MIFKIIYYSLLTKYVYDSINKIKSLYNYYYYYYYYFDLKPWNPENKKKIMFKTI